MSEEKRILCVGLCVLDIIHVCSTYPEEDSDRRCKQGHWQRGGNASNVCTVLSNLGAKCEFLGVLSKSEGFQMLLSDCKERNIITENCPMVSINPPFSSVILNQENDSRTIIHCNPDYPILTYDHFKTNIVDKGFLKNYSWIHFETRNPLETTRMIKDILEYNRIVDENNRIIISLDQEKIKPEHLELNEFADYAIIGKDLALSMGFKNPKETAIEIKKMSSNPKLNVICPWGKEDTACVDSSGNCFMVPIYPTDKIIDTLGAGDTFCAALIFSLNKKKSLNESVEIGNKIAGIKLGFYGYDGLKNLYYFK